MRLDTRVPLLYRSLKLTTRMLVGGLNAILSLGCTKIYMMIVRFAVKLENHPSDFTRKNSLILKNMVYLYTISFLPLLVFTFREKDFDLLSNTISSSMITACLLDILLV